jgi:phosphoglucosamine mutase
MQTMFRLFGTDGIRAPISARHLSPESMARLGQILGLRTRNLATNRNCIVIGRDTRASGLYIEMALASAIAACGVNVEIIGVVPTATLAFATKNLAASFGIMISASHNPSSDNGIKFFDHNGFKISQETEKQIEKDYCDTNITFNIGLSDPGKIIYNNSLISTYCDFLKNSFAEKINFNAMKIVVDCGHGAAFQLAPQLFADLGADVRVIGASPDGHNINQGFGSESPKALQDEIKHGNFDLGIAYDGDADRVIFVDHLGQLLDGEAVLAAFAIDLKKYDRLLKNSLVSTVMSSYALDQAVAPYYIKVLRTGVGDRFVVEMMREGAFNLGGENSGHLIMFPFSSTGDGLSSAVYFLKMMQKEGKSAREICSVYQPTPKILKNLPVKEKIPLTQLPQTTLALAQANSALEGKGRVFFRYSGTESLARILVEAPSQAECESIAHSIVQHYSLEISQLS